MKLSVSGVILASTSSTETPSAWQSGVQVSSASSLAESPQRCRSRSAHMWAAVVSTAVGAARQLGVGPRSAAHVRRVTAVCMLRACATISGGAVDSQPLRPRAFTVSLKLPSLYLQHAMLQSTGGHSSRF